MLEIFIGFASSEVYTFFMKRFIAAASLTLFLLSASTQGANTPAPVTDEQTLNAKVDSINNASITRTNDKFRIDAMAKEYNVSASRITSMRNRNMSWGEITVALSTAGQISATSKSYLSPEQALNRVENMRNKRLGWDSIAQQYGFTLGPVISRVERGERIIRTSTNELVPEKTDSKVFNPEGVDNKASKRLNDLERPLPLSP